MVVMNLVEKVAVEIRRCAKTLNKAPKFAPALRACAGRPNLRLGRPLAWRYGA